MAVYGTFIGPDGTEITYKHNADTCECSECDTARWQKIEKAQAVFKEMCEFEEMCEAEARQEEWDALQAVPSYVEQQARELAQEN